MQGRCGCDPVAKGRMAQAPSLRQQRSGRARRSPGPCRPSNETRKNDPTRVGAGQRIGHCGVERNPQGNSLSVNRRRDGRLPARFTRDGAHDIRTQQAEWCPALRKRRSAALLVSRALECQNLCRDARLHLSPLHSHQRDSGFADDFVRIVGLNAECCASISHPFEPSAQPQGRPWRDRPSMVDTDRTADHHFSGGIDVLLHLTNAKGFDHRDQVSGCQTFDQSLRIPASVRKPREKRLRCLIGRHGVGLFKEYLADALVIHGVSGWWSKARSARWIAGDRCCSMLPRPAGIPNPPQRALT